jgi:NDP-sugar pyrophosphorylase family protein
MRADGTVERASLLHLFSRLAGRGERIAVVYVRGDWLDVDDAFDLARARNFT